MPTPSVEQPENQEAAYQSLIPSTQRVRQEVIPPETDRPEALLPQHTRPGISEQERDRPESIGPSSYDYPYQHMIQRIRRFFGFPSITRQSYLEPVSPSSSHRPLSSDSGYLDPISEGKSFELSLAQHLTDKPVISEDSKANISRTSHFDDISTESLEHDHSENIPIQQHESETVQSFKITTLRPRSNREESLYAELDETKMIGI